MSGDINSQRIALLSYRLNFCVNSHTLAEDLISNWLRWLGYINPTRDVMRTTQPSEPILAHIAARMMSNSETRLAILQRFVKSSFEGSINTGDLGEMVTAIILLFAFYDASSRRGKKWPQAIGFQDFLESLLAANACTSYAEYAHGDEEMTKVLTTEYVFANHFQQLTNPPTRDVLLTAFHRGCGLLMPLTSQASTFSSRSITPKTPSHISQSR